MNTTSRITDKIRPHHHGRKHDHSSIPSRVTGWDGTHRAGGGTLMAGSVRECQAIWAAMPNKFGTHNHLARAIATCPDCGAEVGVVLRLSRGRGQITYKGEPPTAADIDRLPADPGR